MCVIIYDILNSGHTILDQLRQNIFFEIIKGKFNKNSNDDKTISKHYTFQSSRIQIKFT